MVRGLTPARPWRWAIISPAIAGGIIGLLISWPSDPPIPTTLPEETHRVHHPRGFSMILPPNWQGHLRDLAELGSVISGTPRSGRAPRRVRFGLMVHQFRIKEDDLSPGSHAVIFQGLPAREREAIEETNYHWGPHFVYELSFEREGRRYLIRYDHPGRIETLPDMVRRYLLTFRVEGAEPG